MTVERFEVFRSFALGKVVCVEASDFDAALARETALLRDQEDKAISIGCLSDRLSTAQSELAALREELAIIKDECIDHVNLHKAWTKQRDDLQQRLAAAEQRNVALTKAIIDAEYRADQGKVWNGMGWTYTGLHSHGQQKVLDILRAALNPTESGASE